MLRHNVLAVILAGGRGSRLEPLTRDRAKPAVPFGGAYRIIDFTLSNCYNSGLRRILLLTQYKAMSLDRHISIGWDRYFCRETGEYADVVPPQQYVDENWYLGTADAVYQNIFAILNEKPEYIIVLGGDHIYKMDYGKMLDFHIQNKADATVAAIPVSPKEASGQFGVMEVDKTFRIVGFEEKPKCPKLIPGLTDRCLGSMGIYVFNADFLYDELRKDAADKNSKHDFGSNIIPSVINDRRIFGFSFMDENKKTEAYWRDVGTLDAFYQTNMDLVKVDPHLNLYDEEWPVYTFHPNLPPPKFVFASQLRTGLALDSIVCPGSIVSGGFVSNSIIGYCCRINSFSSVESSILFSNVNIGRGCRIRNAIIDKDVSVPAEETIGFDHNRDRQRGFTVTEQGITVVAKQSNIEQT
ncbi:glucose-1-phosphate adenylyltransferase [Planctomycetales bacterium]|nr:glucose-1-phosphate adenylyltransferase [Planctomycetales bacterium]GHT34638.1 glucose-1-phosphate adenylyltransferase [Planctomycetales bacterium]